MISHPLEPIPSLWTVYLYHICCWNPHSFATKSSCLSLFLKSFGLPFSGIAFFWCLAQRMYGFPSLCPEQLLSSLSSTTLFTIYIPPPHVHPSHTSSIIRTCNRAGADVTGVDCHHMHVFPFFSPNKLVLSWVIYACPVCQPMREVIRRPHLGKVLKSEPTYWKELLYSKEAP